MEPAGNNSSMADGLSSDQAVKMELYSIVLSATTLCLAILFGGGGCVTVLVAMCVHKLMRKLRFVLIAVLLVVCSAFDFVWCPVEISRLMLYQQNNVNGNVIPSEASADLKYLGHTVYILLLCGLAAIIVLICIQNLLKMIQRYDSIPKMKFGLLLILFWLVVSISLTIAYLLTSAAQADEQTYHTINSRSFHFKLIVQSLWIFLLLIPIIFMLAFHIHRRLQLRAADRESELSDLHSNDNFTVPTLLIKSVEELDDVEADDEAVDEKEGSSQEIQKMSRSGSPASQSAMKKRHGSPSSQKVNFADDLPSPSREKKSTTFGNECKMKSQNHLGVNMAAILGRRRHTIAQISDPHLDLIQKAKQYNYVRKFSVDINALQAQLENPKMHDPAFPFHSETDIQTSGKTQNMKETSLQERKRALRKTSMEECNEIATDEEVISEHVADDSDEKRDSICPTPPLISLTQSDGEEKQLDLGVRLPPKHKPSNPCKLPCLLVATFLCCLLPMFITEAVRHHLSPNTYVNIITCTMALSVVQTMIYPQIIFCVDSTINKVVHRSLVRTRRRILHLFYQQEEVSTTEDVSDTEV